MRKQTFYTGLIMFAVAVFLAAACQTQSPANSVNSGNTRTNATDHSGHDMSNMNMNGHEMSDMKSAPDAASQPFDLQFIDSMIHHHEGALKMSKEILTKERHSELEAFAQQIIRDQEKEINDMKKWREQWYPGKPNALNLELPGMKMSEMGPMPTTDVEHQFLTMMTQHHEGAVLMAQDALKRGEHAEIKKLAENIIKTQNAEIEKMKAWQKEWAK